MELQPDGLHPTGAGYQAWAERIWAWLLASDRAPKVPVSIHLRWPSRLATALVVAGAVWAVRRRAI